MLKFNFLKQNSKRRGSALIIAIFVAAASSLVIISMMDMATTNINQITDTRSGQTAFYAAESGLETVKNFFNKDISSLGISLSSLDLPQPNDVEILSNDAVFWVDSITYNAENTAAIIDIIGQKDDAFRRIRATLTAAIPSIFNDYGLLTNGVLTINGTKILGMSIHANDGLKLVGTDTLENNSVATQSSDPDADPPNAATNPVGGYVPDINVPLVPIDDYRTLSQSDGYFLDITQEDLNSQINATPAESNVYINPTSKIQDNNLTLSGDMEGKFIFIDGDVNINIDGAEDLSNVTVVASGEIVVNGSVDIGTAHQDNLDVVFASGGDVELNGSRSFKSVFWTNGRFTQNGASLSGRVIAEEAIFLNGSFTLTSSDILVDNDAFDKEMETTSWQILPLDN